MLHDIFSSYYNIEQVLNENFIYELSKGCKINKEDILRLNHNRDVEEVLQELDAVYKL